MQVSRTTLKVRFGTTQRARTPLGFHKRDCPLFRHGPAAVLAVRTRQCRRELEPNNFSFHHSRRIHAAKLYGKLQPDKPCNFNTVTPGTLNKRGQSRGTAERIPRSSKAGQLAIRERANTSE